MVDNSLVPVDMVSELVHHMVDSMHHNKQYHNMENMTAHKDHKDHRVHMMGHTVHNHHRLAHIMRRFPCNAFVYYSHPLSYWHSAVETRLDSNLERGSTYMQLAPGKAIADICLASHFF